VEMHQEKPENQTSSFSEGTPNLDHEQENCVRNDSNLVVLSVKVLGGQYQVGFGQAGPQSRF